MKTLLATMFIGEKCFDYDCCCCWNVKLWSHLIWYTAVKKWAKSRMIQLPRESMHFLFSLLYPHPYLMMLFSQVRIDAFGRTYYRQQIHTHSLSLCTVVQNTRSVHVSVSMCVRTMCICWKWFYEWNDVIRFAWEKWTRLRAYTTNEKSPDENTNAYTRLSAHTYEHTHSFTFAHVEYEKAA